MIEFLNTKSGRYLVFAADFDIAEQLRKTGVHDQAVIEEGAALIDAHGGSGKVIIDAGAHLGTFSIPLARRGGFSVQAFEAQRIVAQLLGANYLLNDIEDAWVHTIALGASEGPDTVKIPRADFKNSGNFGAFSVDPKIQSERSAARIQFKTTMEDVACRSLDSFGFTGVCLIKIDVEGQELDVLKGAVDTIRNNGFPPLLFECWQSEGFREQRERTVAFVEDLGYTCKFFGENIAATKV